MLTYGMSQSDWADYDAWESRAGADERDELAACDAYGYDDSAPDAIVTYHNRFWPSLSGIVALLDDGVTTASIDGNVAIVTYASGERAFHYTARVIDNPYDMGDFITLTRTANENGDWTIVL